MEDEQQNHAAQTIAEKNLSVREAEELVRRLQNPVASAVSNKQSSVDPTVQELQTLLQSKLGKNALIQHKVNGKGKVILKYRSLLELRAILSNLFD